MAIELMDARRLRYVTSRYPQLQGLRLLPLAVVFLVSSCWRAGVIHLPGDRTPRGAEAWFFAALGTAITASYVVRVWYARRLGAVGQYAGHSAAIPILGTSAVAGLALWLQITMNWQVSLPALVVGTALLGTGAAHYPFRRHYISAAALFFAFAALRVAGVSGAVLDAALDGFIAIALLIAAFGDHLLLTRTLQRGAGDMV